MADEPGARLSNLATIALGLVVLVGFGVWFYGYGVLLEPIGRDTGWSEGLLSATYGAAMLGSGALATIVGRLLTTTGSRLLYGAGAAVVLPGYQLLAATESAGLFVAVGVVVGSVTGALGYYAAVHTIIARLVSPGARAGSITTNTLWGAMASPVFLPLMAWLVVRIGWRDTLRVTGGALAAALLLVALFVPDTRSTVGESSSLRKALAAARRDRVTLAVLAVTFAGGVSMSLVILYQVPVMVTAGLTLASASSLAGARGFLQIGGRIPMPWLVRRLGSRRTLRGSHLLIGLSCLILPFAGTLPLGLLFAVVAGLAIGAVVPVESIFTSELFSAESVGVVYGLASLARGIGFALGPVVGGAVSTAAGSRSPVLVGAAIVAVCAAMSVPPSRPTDG